MIFLFIIKITVVSNLKGVLDSMFSTDWSKYIAVVSSSQISQKLEPKTRAPYRIGISPQILFNRILQNVVSILSPSISNIYVGSSSCEKHSIDFGKNAVQIWCIGESENGNNLSSGHLNKFNIGGSDISEILGCLLRRVRLSQCRFITFIWKSEYSYHWILRRKLTFDQKNHKKKDCQSFPQHI